MALTKNEAQEIAADYLKQAAELMRKYGEESELSGKRYQSALRSIARTFETLDSAR